jgi:general secretion pathway protein A
VKRLDLPAVLELGAPAGERRWLAVTALDDRRAVIDLGTQRVTVPLEELARDWDGAFVALWKPPRAGLGTIGPRAATADVAWLRQRLGALDGRRVASSEARQRYDTLLAERIAEFQRAQGLKPDGLAGDETLARLTAVLDASAPSLAAPRT